LSGTPSNQYGAPSAKDRFGGAPSTQYGAPSSFGRSPSTQYGTPSNGGFGNTPSSRYSAPSSSSRSGGPNGASGPHVSNGGYDYSRGRNGQQDDDLSVSLTVSHILMYFTQ
jgi:hypothetical protein